MKLSSQIFSALILATVLFSSCCLGDKIPSYNYVVTNASDTTIIVDFLSDTDVTFEREFAIEVGQTITVLTTSSGPIVNSCESLDLDPNILESDLESFIVVNGDGLISTRDYLGVSEWNYSEDGAVSYTHLTLPTICSV